MQGFSTTFFPCSTAPNNDPPTLIAFIGTAGINRSNTAARAVLEQPCSTGGRTGTVRPKHLPAGRTGLSDQFLGPVAQDQPGPVGQICPTSWVSLRSDSARPTTGRTRLFEHRSNCRVRPVNAGSVESFIISLLWSSTTAIFFLHLLSLKIGLKTAIQKL
ncbi:hypothetical protein PCASD_13877 [Puccinia coronata f. sp. avenae]|uniref:Uncharacterized protein n=1 Tax=Puccinia coronata f. sp. avenae TaxID=200324 RepID=A0A2N5U840_9BASI|nr:hypothetical protein PCASD_13877 [Puccinia coronata f. sp. avenae]